MAQCRDIGRDHDRGQWSGPNPLGEDANLPRQPKAEMPDFVCTHPYWLNIDDVYKNAPNKKAKLQSEKRPISRLTLR